MREGSDENKKRAQKAAAILSSQQSMITKVRKIVALGYDEEEAEKLVELSQMSVGQPVYYEQLPQAPYEAR